MQEDCSIMGFGVCDGNIGCSALAKQVLVSADRDLARIYGLKYDRMNDLAEVSISIWERIIITKPRER